MVILLAQAVTEEGQHRPDDQSSQRNADPSGGGSENFSKMGSEASLRDTDSRRLGIESFPKMGSDGQLSHSRTGKIFWLGSGKETGLIKSRWGRRKEYYRFYFWCMQLQAKKKILEEI